MPLLEASTLLMNELKSNFTLFMTGLIIYIYAWKLNQTVLELDLWAVNFLFFPRRDLNSHHWYTAAPKRLALCPAP